MSKCLFGSTTINLLGHTITPQHMSVQEAKVRCVLEMRAPTRASEVKSFLGLANFYRAFIPGLADRSIELNRIQQPNNFEWTALAQVEFDWIKAALAARPILRIPDAFGLLRLETDASDYASAWVLNQMVDDVPHVVCYGSRLHSKSERNYSAIEKEALAVVKGVTSWMRYLAATRFQLIVDQKPLTYLLKGGPLAPAMSQGKLNRWRILLQCYRYDPLYRRGEDNIADCLSRLVPHGPLSADASWDADALTEAALSRQIPDSPLRADVRRVQTVAPADAAAYACIAEAHARDHVAADALVERLRAAGHNWPRMPAQCAAFVNACATCCFDRSTGRFEPPTGQFIVTTHVNDVLAIDFVGPLHERDGTLRHLLTVLDIDSGFLHAAVTADCTAASAITMLTRVCSASGYQTRF